MYIGHLDLLLSDIFILETELFVQATLVAHRTVTIINMGGPTQLLGTAGNGAGIYEALLALSVLVHVAD